MTYQQVLENARTCIGPYCKACNDCNGKVCRNTMPGPGAKGEGTGFIRNAEKWREICVNMDTICENSPVDTSFTLFGRTFEIPSFAAPVGAMRLHYGDKYDDLTYNDILVRACRRWSRARLRRSRRTAAAACRPSSRGIWTRSAKNSRSCRNPSPSPSRWTSTRRVCRFCRA